MKIPEYIRAVTDSALQEAIEIFHSDPDSIYASELERRQLKYKDKPKTNKWKTNKQCSYELCDQKSIENSHSIQKSNSIALIEENGHVLSPKFNNDREVLEMVPKGINQASTFPGFCLHHENLFNEFEIKKDLTDQKHFVLQIYRSICRDLVDSQNNLNDLDREMKVYINFRDEKLNEMVIQKIGKDFMEFYQISNYNIKLEQGDRMEIAMKKAMVNLKKYVESLEKLKRAISNDVEKGRFQKIFCYPIEIGFEMPVAISGKGNFMIETKNKKKFVEMVYNVLPQKGKTYIVMCGHKKHTKFIRMYAKQFRHPLQFISLIERWMVHGSDNWYIKPSVWNLLDENRKKYIISSIQSISYGIGSEFKHSILDELRKEYLELAVKYEDNFDYGMIEFISKERNKFKLPE